MTTIAKSAWRSRLLSLCESPKCYRGAFLGFLLVTLWKRDVTQAGIDKIWTYLLQSWVFNSVYFETWFATVCYTFLLYVPFRMCHSPYFARFKIDKRVTFDSPGFRRIFEEMVEYCLPLMTLDTVMVKKYCGVPMEELIEKRKSWIQQTRALPKESVNYELFLFQLLASLLLYDALFFFIHYILHKNTWIYKNFHAVHHNHGVIQSRITNQLSVSERITLVLTANFALKVFQSHPFTRMVFIPVFVWLLIENHSGLDLPWGYGKLIPFNLSGGSRAHFYHHVYGIRHYQPFLNYLDRFAAHLEKRFQLNAF